MRVRYFSDLHLEFIKPEGIEEFIRKIPSGVNEICILAGDIGNPYQKNYDLFMSFISKNFMKTFVIAGNHEYYNETKTIQETTKFMINYFQRFNNISFLDYSYEIYANHCFIGTTLWSEITNPEYEINDVHRIPEFDIIKYNALNRLSIDFLKNAVHSNKNCIVITHHMPSESLIDKKYKTSVMKPYNQWFYSNMDKFIKTKKIKKRIAYWVYGHTHTPSEVRINDIPFLCNPIGYPNENSMLDFQKSFTISAPNVKQ